MTTDLGAKEIAVLQAIQDGAETVPEIREKTTLTSREINYRLNEYSLEELGLVEIDRKEGREWLEIDGEERYVLKPKKVQLTDKALQILAEHETNAERYEDMSKQELIERIHELEQRQDRLETVFKDFRQKVMKRI